MRVQKDNFFPLNWLSIKQFLVGVERGRSIEWFNEKIVRGQSFGNGYLRGKFSFLTTLENFNVHPRTEPIR